MMVTFVSQCEKKSLNKTRRVLDAFANRIGNRTWQTVITNEGLQAVKKLLRKTASKNTAVSCHWIRSRSHSEFLWVVGNRDKFNEQGIVPVNFTEKDVSHYRDSAQWKTLNVIQYCSSIAGLFHDFGKANILFQDKLKPAKKTKAFEPYRHEWLSMRLFQAFVGDKSDVLWLEALAQLDRSAFPDCFKDGINGGISDNHSFENLPPLARLVAWLILTHHKLPLYPSWKENAFPPLVDCDKWLEKNFQAFWNSHNCKDKELEEQIEKNWTFKALPTESIQWRSQTCLTASEAAYRLKPYSDQDINWLEQHVLTTHLSRLCLILADHYYSSLAPGEGLAKQCATNKYNVWANTDRSSGLLKQKLDEHLMGVACHAQDIAKALPKLNASLTSLKTNDFLTKKVSKDKKEDFGWQDEAKKLAQKLGKSTIDHGFFGINMASTGRGKTLANAKIMTAIGSQTDRTRFNVALGLRTLTLQTGREYRNMLRLDDKQLAIAVGGVAVKTLFENEQQKAVTGKQKDLEKNEHEGSNPEQSGSESAEELLDSDMYVDFQPDFENHSLSLWTKNNEKVEKLIHAPLLVCTIDHLMPATEGTKGGRQIPAMLRLLTSDLVLDEPDDFGQNDLPALCRLVYWSAMLGSRVLLSTATLPPALCSALYQSYKVGWEQYAQANIENWTGDIICAWFDENKCESSSHKTHDTFKEAHRKYTSSRSSWLLKNDKGQRKGKIVSVCDDQDKPVSLRMATTIHEQVLNLHTLHKENNPSKDIKKISIGLVRMANINPLVAVAKHLVKQNVPQNTHIHYCIYHSRYPLAIRSHIETSLDKVLNRKQPEQIWTRSEITEIVQKHPKVTNHIFVVLASPVAEVGRDHDYDWAIVEPSSMRSIIQLAGRVLRHRSIVPNHPNIVLLNKNYKALRNDNKGTACFLRPGFEDTESLMLSSHDLNEILKSEDYESITAIPRITLPEDYKKIEKKYRYLTKLEHKALAHTLFIGKDPAKVWWENHPHWCGEVQRQQKFRQSPKDEAHYLCIKDEYSELKWQWKNENIFPPVFGESYIQNTPSELELTTDGVGFWFNLDPLKIYQALGKDCNMDLSTVSRTFGEVRVVNYNSNTPEDYFYDTHLGLHKEIEINRKI